MFIFNVVTRCFWKLWKIDLDFLEDVEFYEFKSYESYFDGSLSSETAVFTNLFSF